MSAVPQRITATFAHKFDMMPSLKSNMFSCRTNAMRNNSKLGASTLEAT